jgi:hypothetical protein
MILPFVYNGYKRLSENKRFPNHRWYSDDTWGKMGECSLFHSVPVTVLRKASQVTLLRAMSQILSILIYCNIYLLLFALVIQKSMVILMMKKVFLIHDLSPDL